MPKIIKPLKKAEVAALTKTTAVGGCNGLTLLVDPSPEGVARSWVLRYTVAGVARSMGLGSAQFVSVDDARTAGNEIHRKIKLTGTDPQEEKRALREVAAQESAERKKLDVTFKKFALDFIDAREASGKWSNSKSSMAWTNTLTNYVFPHFGKKRIGAVRAVHVIEAIEPIMNKINDTTDDIVDRLKAIFAAAIAKELHPGPNPADKAALTSVNFRRKKSKPHESLPHAEVAAFYHDSEKHYGFGSLALRFTILTAARIGEVMGARRGQFDFENATWKRPADLMKARVEHRIPLSPEALALVRLNLARLDERREVKPDADDLIFEGQKRGQMIPQNTLLKVVKTLRPRNVYPAYTTHGFRATFKDWARESGYSEELSELSLAHEFGSDQSQSYIRGDLLEQRRDVMQAWAQYTTARSEGGNVAPIAGRTGRPLRVKKDNTQKAA